MRLRLTNSSASMSRRRRFQTSGLQRCGPACTPIPSTGSKSQKFITSRRVWQSIQRTDGSTARRREQRTQLLGLRMQRRARRDRAERQQHHRRPAAADLGIEFKRAHHHRRRQRAAAAVADHDDLVGLVRGDRGDEPLRAGLDRRIEAGRLAARECAQIRPVIVDLNDEPAIREPAQQHEGSPSAAATPRGTVTNNGRPAIARRQVRDQPSARERYAKPQQQHALEVEQHRAEIPRRAQHAKDGSADDVIESPSQARWESAATTARSCWRG